MLGGPYRYVLIVIIIMKWYRSSSSGQEGNQEIKKEREKLKVLKDRRFTSKSLRMVLPRKTIYRP